MELLVKLTIEEKVELLYPDEALEMTDANIISRTQDVLADSTKHDEIASWRITRVEQAFYPTASAD